MPWFYSADPDFCLSSVRGHMSWVRTHRKFGGTLALFALALQLALSFGHIHVRDFAGIPGAPVAHAQLTAPHGPDGHATDQASDDYCLVCATIALSGTLVLPALPAVPPPSISTYVTHWYRFADRRDRFDHALFSARAPPLA
jgi:hypothetical protein